LRFAFCKNFPDLKSDAPANAKNEDPTNAGQLRVILDALRSMMDDRRVLLFVAGKSSLLANSVVDWTSPFFGKFLAMSALKPCDVVEIVEKWSYCGEKLKDLFKRKFEMSEEGVQLLAERIQHYTSGVPRLVQYSLNALVELSLTEVWGNGNGGGKRSLKDRNAIDGILTTEVFDYLLQNRKLWPQPHWLEPATEQALLRVLLMAYQGTLFRGTDKWEKGAFEGKPIVDVLAVMQFWCVPDYAQNGHLRLILPPYLLMNRKYWNEVEMRLSDPVAAFERFLRSPIAGDALNQGRTFEAYVAFRISQELRRVLGYAENPDGGESFLNQVGEESGAMVDLLIALGRARRREEYETNRFSVHWMPGSEKGGTVKSIEKMLKKPREMIPEGKVALGRISNSPFVDIVVRCSGREGRHQFLGVACKNFVTEELSPGMIQHEINNFKPVLKHGTGTLLVVATRVQLQVDAKSLFRVLTNKNDLGLVVPKGMEVVVLSEKETELFLGMEVLKLLRTEFCNPREWVLGAF